MILQLECFVKESTEKNETLVHIPTGFSDLEMGEGVRTYGVRTIIRHLGSTAKSGHYTAVIRDLEE
jgi:uncharacterized UBP type Zn finger protein